MLPQRAVSIPAASPAVPSPGSVPPSEIASSSLAPATTPSDGLDFDDETGKVPESKESRAAAGASRDSEPNLRTAIVRGVPRVTALHDAVARNAMAKGLPSEEGTLTRALELGVTPARRAVEGEVANGQNDVARDGDTPTTGIPALPLAQFPLLTDGSRSAPAPIRDRHDPYETDGATTLARSFEAAGPPSRPESSRRIVSPHTTPIGGLNKAHGFDGPDAPASARDFSQPLDSEDASDSQTLARPIRSLDLGVHGGASGDSRPTEVRRDALPPPRPAARTTPHARGPAASAPALQNAAQPNELKATTQDLSRLASELPSYTPASFDPVPEPGAAIRTPMSMVLAPDDNATRIVPLVPPMPAPMMRMQPVQPMQAMQPMQAILQGLPLLRSQRPTARIRPSFLGTHPAVPKAIAFASGAVLVAAIVFILLRAVPSSSTASARGSESAPPEVSQDNVGMTAPVQTAPPPPAPPVAALPVILPPTVQTITPAPTTTGTARSEAPKRRVVSRPPTPKVSTPVSIPIRREE